MDKDTIEWIIDNLTGSEYNSPRYESLTMRRGGEIFDFKYLLAEDLRLWLVELMHQGRYVFLPEDAAADLKRKAEDIKRLEARCACGWVDGFDIDHVNKTYDKDERALDAAHGKHVAEEVEKIRERYQYDD